MRLKFMSASAPLAISAKADVSPIVLMDMMRPIPLLSVPANGVAGTGDANLTVVFQLCEIGGGVTAMGLQRMAR